MKYRVDLDISFTEEADAVSFLNLLQEIKGKVFQGSGEEKIAIVSTCRYFECTHDDPQPIPETDYTYFDLSTIEKEVIKTKLGETVEATKIIETVVQEKIDAAVEIAVNDIKPIVEEPIIEEPIVEKPIEEPIKESGV